MIDAHQTHPSERQPAGEHRRITVVARCVIAVSLLPVLVYLCLQTDHARLKGMPMESWRLFPLIVTAAVSALLGKRFLNRVAGVFLGGIGGAFGTLDDFAGPYGGVVGLVTGAIVVVLPILEKPGAKVMSVAPIVTPTDDERTDRDEHGP